MTFWCRDSLDRIWTVQSIYKALKCHITHPIFQATFTNLIKHIWTSSLVRYILFLKRIQTCSITNKYKCNLHTRKNNNFGGQFCKFHEKENTSTGRLLRKLSHFLLFILWREQSQFVFFWPWGNPSLKPQSQQIPFVSNPSFVLTHKN